jgi:hypothetical protein
MITEHNCKNFVEAKHPNINILLSENRIIISISNFSGGNAADTKRASNQKSFIRQDQNKAIIRIHLYNGGELPFNPAAWGKEIIFEKRILQSGANHFTITGASGKKARDPQAYKAQFIYIRIVSS